VEFTNFSLGASAHPIELESADGVWDLHNTSRFAALTFEPDTRTVICEWIGAPGVWRDQPPTPYGGCQLQFSDVSATKFTLSLLGAVPDPSCLRYMVYDANGVPGGGTLTFEFLDGSRLTITASTVTLVPVLVPAS
jgi:hypothetical protein